MKKKRIEYIDIAKGLLICFLCFHHFPQAVKQVGLPQGDYTCVYFTYKFYACYFMQAFFFITGFCTNFKLDFFSFFTKNLKMLVIPAICFDIISRVFDYVIIARPTKDVFDLRLGFWFLWTLFFCKMLYWLLAKKQSTSILILVTFLALLMIRLATFLNFYYGDEGNWLFNQNVLVMFFFLLVGNVVRSYPFCLKLLPIGGVMFLLLLLSNLICGVKMPYVTGKVDDLDRVFIPNYLAFALTGTMFVLFFSKYIKTNNFLENVGKHSLLIYGFHFLILKAFVALLHNVLHFNTITLLNTNVMFLVSCTLTFITTYSFSVLVAKTKWLSLLTGKW